MNGVVDLAAAYCMNRIDFLPWSQEGTIEIHKLEPFEVQGKNHPWDCDPFLCMSALGSRMSVKGYMHGQLSVQFSFLRIMYIVILGPSANVHKLDRVPIIVKGERIGLFMEIVFIPQFNNGKQTGLKSWTRLVHAWRVAIETGVVTFNFYKKENGSATSFFIFSNFLYSVFCFRSRAPTF